MKRKVTLEHILQGSRKQLKDQSITPSQRLQEANKYMNRGKVQGIYKPSYHFTGEVGWINDPNGFSCYKGEYHLFYQYHPYDIKWGPMHWGHAVTKDFIKWKHSVVAIAPDQSYDEEGCFSGTGLQVEDLHVLMYTGNSNKTLDGVEHSIQVQCIAIGDGTRYIKLDNNPVIRTNQLPKHCSLADFRDPKVWQKENLFYAVIGSRHDDGSGQILLYQSNNLLDWDYIGTLLKSENKIGRMWECPDIFELDGKDILLISPQEIKKEGHRFHNRDGTIYMIGELCYVKGSYKYTCYDEVDYGLDFYAPQTLETTDGRRIMIAWMQSWERNMPSGAFGWAGAMILPRELTLRGDKLIQLPVKEIEQYRKNQVTYQQVKVDGSVQLEDVKGRKIELQIEVDMRRATRFEIQLMKNGKAMTSAIYDVIHQVLTFDRSESQSEIKGLNIRTMPVKLYQNKVKLRILIDTFSIEIFTNDGEGAMSSTVYTKMGKDEILFISNDLTIMDVTKWDLIIA